MVSEAEVDIFLEFPCFLYEPVDVGNLIFFSSVQFSRSVVSDSLRPHESQHARPPCPSPTPGVHSDSRPSSHLTVMPSSHLILCRPLLLLPPIPPSLRVFSNESTLAYICIYQFKSPNSSHCPHLSPTLCLHIHFLHLHLYFCPTSGFFFEQRQFCDLLVLSDQIRSDQSLSRV